MLVLFTLHVGGRIILPVGPTPTLFFVMMKRTYWPTPSLKGICGTDNYSTMYQIFLIQIVFQTVTEQSFILGVL